MTLYPWFISGAEMAFTLFIALLVLGVDNIPDIARGLVKILRMFRDASGSIKDEISKTAKKNGLDTNLFGKVQSEIRKIKDEVEEIAGNFKGNYKDNLLFTEWWNSKNKQNNRWIYNDQTKDYFKKYNNKILIEYSHYDIIKINMNHNNLSFQ